jgi:uncharacterized Zn finger protein
MSWYYGFKPYVPVATRKANARKHAEKLAKKEKRALQPMQVMARNIAKTFWGQAWCENLERYSDYANRLPRGRTYLRNGSVIDLVIKRGQIDAIVSGSEIYNIKIKIDTLKPGHWERVKNDCSASITSVMQLLTGKFDKTVMERLSQKDDGLFPRPQEIKMSCSCPDSAGLCKHLAAVMYGIGARLDSEPELLFTLRDVDHLELVGQAVAAENLNAALQGESDGALGGQDLEAVFGIELAEESASAVATATVAKKTTKPKKKPAAKVKKKPTAGAKKQAR